jgi:protein MPE1
MASSVFFKFKSMKEPQRITFDGTGISVFELKREIIAASGLGDGTDFDLHIYPEDSPTAEYDDDTTIISRSSTVIARRVPASKPGAGRAARYVSGRAPVRAIKHSQRPDPSKPITSNASTAQMSEKEREEAFLQEAEASWEQQKEVMSHAKPVFKKRIQNVPDHPPPPQYVCYRCEEKGHWIQACPTNNDPNFKPKMRVKRTTGIPRSFLKSVEKPTGDDEDMRGVMLNNEGEYVVVEPDRKTWEKYQEKAMASAAQAETAAATNKEIQERGLECSIDKRMFVEPVKTPCCGKTYCHDCIENALAESDLVCPNCAKEGVLIDDLAADDDMVEKIRVYEAEKAKEKADKEKQAKEEAKAAANPSSPSNNNDVSVPSTTDGEAKDSESNGSGAQSPSKQNVSNQTSSVNQSVTAATSNKASTPVPGSSGGNGSDTDSSTTSKKRKADSDLTNDRKPAPPTAPKAMRQQQEQHQTTDNKVEQFMHQMEALKSLPLSNVTVGMSMPMPMNPVMPMMGPGMNGMNMPNMGNWNGFPNGYQNAYGMPYGNMNNMNGMNPMAMNGMGMNMNPNMGGGNMGYGAWNQGQTQNYGGGNMNMGYNPNMSVAAGHFPNQQRTVFAQPLPSEDDAYFRKPVNPQRHQNRNRRQRPSDYHYVG